MLVKLSMIIGGILVCGVSRYFDRVWLNMLCWCIFFVSSWFEWWFCRCNSRCMLLGGELICIWECNMFFRLVMVMVWCWVYRCCMCWIWWVKCFLVMKLVMICCVRVGVVLEKSCVLCWKYFICDCGIIR